MAYFLRVLLSAILVAATHYVFIAPGFAQSDTAKPVAMEQKLPDEYFSDLFARVLIGTEDERKTAMGELVARGKLDIVPTLTLFMNIGGDPIHIADALSKLTGANIKTWRDAMLWQEAHPEIIPHPSYRELKLRYFSSIDPKFLQFFDPEFTSRDRMKIRFEEIIWGGVRVDGIPSLDNPELISVSAADYMLEDDLVFGVNINGDARAYPLRIMGWHEMFNEVIGGVPVALAYCTLCGSGILFETSVEGRKNPFIFGSSGFLYRSNKLMYDRETNSLWNQFTGEPVGGPLVDENIKLKIRPVVITSWKNWIGKHPETKVLSLNTGYHRNYDSGHVYKEYFASPNLMFPTIVRDESIVRRKDYVFGVRKFGAAKAWPISAFKVKKVINDQVGNTKLVLIGDASTRTVRAYESKGIQFTALEGLNTIKGKDGSWQITEDALIAADGTRLQRIAGHISFWFAWDSYLGVKSALYTPEG